MSAAAYPERVRRAPAVGLTERARSYRVMSMHASKGLTADLVIMAGLVEGVMPRVDRQAAVDAQEAQLQSSGGSSLLA